MVGGKVVLKVFEQCCECQDEGDFNVLRDLFHNTHLSVLDFTSVSFLKNPVTNIFLKTFAGSSEKYWLSRRGDAVSRASPALPELGAFLVLRAAVGGGGDGFMVGCELFTAFSLMLSE